MSLRVLHLLNDITTAGNGIVNSAVDIAWGQVRSGYQVAVASGGGGYEALLQASGVHHYTLRQQRRPVALARALFDLNRIVREFRPEVVHCHMVTGAVLARTVRLLLRPFRMIAHVHNVHQRSSSIMRLADMVIASSDGVASSMAEQGIPENRMRVVRYRTLGTPRLPSFESFQPVQLAQPAILTVAGMYKRKGIDVLISAFDSIAGEFPAAHLYLVGDGPDRAEFERMAAACTSASRIHFEGFQSNPQTYMRSARIFVLASHRESFGLVLLEARQAGAAIVASNVDGIPEALDGGAAGILCRAGDKDALAAEIRKLLCDPELCNHWRQAARQNLDEFEVARMVEQVGAVYQEVLKGSGPVRVSSPRVSLAGE